MGSAGPPELNDFLLDREFWKELGWTAEYRKSRPVRQVRDYAFFIDMINREKQAQANRRR